MYRYDFYSDDKISFFENKIVSLLASVTLGNVGIGLNINKTLT